MPILVDSERLFEVEAIKVARNTLQDPFVRPAEQIQHTDTWYRFVYLFNNKSGEVSNGPTMQYDNLRRLMSKHHEIDDKLVIN